jgi:hypothetical protein
LAKFDELEIDILSISKFWRHPIMNHKQLVQQLNEMQSQMERYKAELANLRNQVSSYENVETPVPTSDTTSRRKLLKRLAIAGIGGIGALGLAAATNPNYTVLAESPEQNAIEAVGGGNGYGLRASGGLAPLYLNPGGALGKPTTGTHQKGELYVDFGGDLFYCIGDGAPGTWRKLAGPATAGSTHFLPSPERFIDTRSSNTNLGGGPATAISANTTRNYVVTGRNGQNNNSSLQVPAGAVAIVGNVFSLDGSGGYLTIWPTDAAKPATATLFYSSGPGGSAFSTKLSASGSLSIFASTTTNVTLDITGYYL